MKRRHLVSWSGSILLHLLFAASVAWLLWRPARFSVEAGQSSMKLELIQMDERPMPEAPKFVPSFVPLSNVPAPLPIFHQELPKIPAPPVLMRPRTATLARSVQVKLRGPTAPSQGAVTAMPDDLHNEPPEYPEESRHAREEGVVVLRVRVTAMGLPSKVELARSSGFFQLDQAARRAVQRWRFHPAMRGGTAVESEVEVPVRFRLE